MLAAEATWTAAVAAALLVVLAPVSVEAPKPGGGEDGGFVPVQEDTDGNVKVNEVAPDAANIEVEVLVAAAAPRDSSTGLNGAGWQDSGLASDVAEVGTPSQAPEVVGAATGGTICAIFGANFAGCEPAALQPEMNAPAEAPALAVDPQILAAQAVSEIRVPSPQISVGPDLDKVAVNLWTWLWITPPDPVQVTVSAGAISVTAIAELTSVDWTMGEPTKDAESGQLGAPAVVSCEGAGVAPDLESYDWKAEPPCGYKYQQRSLPERTAGRGTWTLTATANWTVNWQATTGETGTTTLTSAAVEEVAVGEYRTLLVDQPR